ncbi:DUF2304 family protein [Candidatus Pelagibacter bacterium]|nr:DUF2304 family protein [Candidatus Pelagibacter bacterium]
MSIVSILFSLMMIYITLINYKRKILDKLNYFIWNAVWIGIILISIRPSFVDDYFNENFKIDIFYILSIVSIISLVILYYINLIKIKVLEKKINTIIRAESLKDILTKIKK